MEIDSSVALVRTPTHAEYTFPQMLLHMKAAVVTPCKKKIKRLGA